MLSSRPRCSMYVIVAVYGLTFLFNAAGILGTGQRRLGTFLADVQGRCDCAWHAHEKSRARAGDVLEAVNGQPLNPMPDWSLAGSGIVEERICQRSAKEVSAGPNRTATLGSLADSARRRSNSRAGH